MDIQLQLERLLGTWMEFLQPRRVGSNQELSLSGNELQDSQPAVAAAFQHLVVGEHLVNDVAFIPFASEPARAIAFHMATDNHEYIRMMTNEFLPHLLSVII